MKETQIRLNAVEERMLKEAQKRNKVYKDLEVPLKQQIEANYHELIQRVCRRSQAFTRITTNDLKWEFRCFYEW